MTHDQNEQPTEAAPRPVGRPRRDQHDLLAAAAAVFVESGVDAPVRQIAARAGVGMGTVYRHFPDEQGLFDACTTHYYSRHPMPDPQHWAEIRRPDERLRTALAELYAWYADTEPMLRAGIRDIEQVPARSREAFLGYFGTVHAALMTGRIERGRPRARVSGAIAHATRPKWNRVLDGGIYVYTM